MRAIVYNTAGGPEVLHLVDRPIPDPGEGEVRVKIGVSGVNPTDWKRRAGAMAPGVTEQVPNQDGAGVIDAVGEGVLQSWLGQRVWIWEAAWQRANGTAQEYVVVPQRNSVPLPDSASLELGASLGIPALTAHRALTVAGTGPSRLAHGALVGKTVLVAGGAGAVGNAAIQLARWAGAKVITTVSGEVKAGLAASAGATHVVNYRSGDTIEKVRAIAPEGVDLFVEVAPDANADLDQAVAAPNATIAFYADDGASDVRIPIRDSMTKNLRWQGILVYTVSDQAKADAVAGVRAAVEAGALRSGEDAGMPVHRFALEDTAEAHSAVEGRVVGRVLITVAEGDEAGR